MAKSSYDKYYEDLYASGKGSVSAQETALKNAAQKGKDLINQTAEEEINAITEDYNSSVADVNQQYEDAFKRNATQRALNERYLERKSAEMGLTDSGLNRTQITANQLSYANQNANLDAGLIKDVNALSAAMKARKLETEQKRRNDIATVESNLESSRAKLWSDYDTNVRSTAEDLYKTDQTDATKAATELNDLVGVLSKSDDDSDSNYLSPAAKQSYIKNYINQFGMSPALSNVLNQFGYNTEDISKNAYTEFLKSYMLNPNVSKNEKIQQFLSLYANYGTPSDEFIRTMENVPLQYVSGISLKTLEDAIRSAYGE